jgi:hypothetical protein
MHAGRLIFKTHAARLSAVARNLARERKAKPDLLSSGQEAAMKLVLTTLLLIARLGGCAIAAFDTGYGTGVYDRGHPLAEHNT